MEKQARANGKVRSPSLKINALSNCAGFFINALIGVFLMPAIVRHLSEKQFGMWTLVWSIVSYFSLLGLNTGSSIMRYLPAYRGKQDHAGINSIFSTGLVFQTCIGIFIILLTFSTADHISAYFAGGKEFARLIQITGLITAIAFFGTGFDSVIRGFEGFVVINIITIISSLLRAFALFFCIWRGYSLLTMAWSLVLTSGVTYLLSFGLVRLRYPQVRFSLKAASLHNLKILVSFGIFLMISDAAFLLALDSPKLIVARTISLESVGFLGIAILLMNYYRQAVCAVTKVFMPRFSFLSGFDSSQRIRNLFLNGTRYTAAFASFIAVMIWVMGPAFLQLWLKKSFEQTVPLMLILSVGTLVQSSQRLSAELLYGLERQKFLTFVFLIEGLAVCVTSFALSLKWGIIGAAVGASIPIALVEGLVKEFYVCRLLKINFMRYYADCMLKPWLLAVSVLAACKLLNPVRHVTGWPSFFVVSFAVAAVYAAIAALILMRPRKYGEEVIINKILCKASAGAK